jgi:hypothetical protein
VRPHERADVNSGAWSAVGAVVGAAVAVIGTVIAVWSARIARAAALSARDSADAAAEQTRLLRHQAEDESTARDEAAGPRLSIGVAGGAEVGTYALSAGGDDNFVPIAKDSRPDMSTWLRRSPVRIVMIDGPPEVSIRIAVADAERERYRVIDGGPHHMVPQSVRQVMVVGPYQPPDQRVELVIHSEEPDGRRRSWVCRQSVLL